MTSKVDIYLAEGCGRCEHYRTPQCNVHKWQEELIILRKYVLDCGLFEDYKWSQPCYTLDNKNVLIIAAMKESCCISFFKGALLSDPGHLLVAPGKSSQAARLLRFINKQDIIEQEAIIKTFITNAIANEQAGLAVEFKKNPEPIPHELKQKMDHDERFKNAFQKLTPGRQRGYIIYFSQPKQAKTRIARIEKCQTKILNGQGLNDDYRAKKNS